MRSAANFQRMRAVPKQAIAVRYVSICCNIERENEIDVRTVSLVGAIAVHQEWWLYDRPLLPPRTDSARLIFNEHGWFSFNKCQQVPNWANVRVCRGACKTDACRSLFS